MVRGGENVPVGAVLGLIGDAGEMADSASAAQSEPPRTENGPPAEEAARKPESTPPPVSVSSPGDMPHKKASPLVRRLAREQGLKLEQITGSGPLD